VWANNSSRALIGEEGRILLYEGIVVDITERKNAIEALRESESLLRVAGHLAQVGGWSVTLPGNRVKWSEEVAAIHEMPAGFSPTVEEGIKFYAPGYRDKIAAVFTACTRDGKAFDEEMQIITAGGNTVWVRTMGVAQRDECGTIIAVKGALRDISDQKRAQEALRESEERFHKAFMSSPAPLVISEIDTGRMIEVNEQWVKMLGYTREEQIGRTSREIGIWSDPKERDLLVQRIMAEGHVKEYPVVFLSKSGQNVFALWSAESVSLAGSRVMLSMILDQTERKNAEKEKEKLQRQLLQAQKMESVGRLAGGVAHDYNNMLSVISGYTEMALEKVPPDSPLHADLSEIFEAAARSTEITRQLLAFARKQTIAPRLIDLNDTIESMLKILRRLIGEDIDLQWLPGIALPPVFLDPSQVDQILANLCVNARDAIAGVGLITIQTAIVTLDETHCQTHAGFSPGEFISLAVVDNGCGMDEETLSNIFEPFYTTKALGEGTGLGLATVYGIVKQNDGFIHVHSEVGKGSTITIYLPRHSGPIEGAVLREAKAPPGQGKTVLLVEDEPAIMRMVQAMLKRLGYHVLAAASPAQAFQLAEQHDAAIDVLLSDVVMPEMNGREVAERISRLFPKVKTIFMSGYTADVIAHRGVLEEGTRFIQKPFSARDLGVKIGRVLDEQ
jgi:two-component system, cell cycle sensor histidine kinase and response regulator CckA